MAVVSVLAACGGSASETPPPKATPPETTTAGTATAALPCAPIRVDCTSAEVIAAVEDLYAIAGATAAEAECLARISGEGTHSVAEAFDTPTDAETQATIECVGSEERLRTITKALADYFEEHPLG